MLPVTWICADLPASSLTSHATQSSVLRPLPVAERTVAPSIRRLTVVRVVGFVVASAVPPTRKLM